VTGAGVRSRPVGPALLLVAIALLAFQLRGPLVAFSPVARAAEAGLGVSAAGLGLLTSVPVLCFGLATPLASVAARRFGLEGAIEVCLAGIVVATVLRSLGGYPLAVASVVLLGVFITIGNVLVPSIIRRDVPTRARGAATGVYSVAINVGTMLTAVATVPLSDLLGWRVATAAWSVVGVAAAGLWLVLLHHQRSLPPAASPPVVPGPARPGALAWLLGLTFAAQAFSYYGVTTWLPTLLADERHLGASAAGTASSVFQLAGVLGSAGVPLLALRLRPWQTLAIVGALWICLPAGLLLAPERYILVSVLGGAAQGGGFAAVFTIIAQVGRDARHATTLSAFVQTVGYLVAAAAPPLVGGLHQVSGGWTAPMLAVLAATVCFLLLGTTAALLAGRESAAAATAETAS
jgi:MFS transporter, CP family, cyanate transporter